METPRTPQQTPDGGGRSPRPPAEMPRGYFQPYCSCPPHDGPCRTADEEPTRSPRRAMWRGVDQPASQASSEREHLAAQRDRDIEAGVDPVEAIAEYEEAIAEYEEATRSPRAPKSAFECLCATDPDGCPIHRHYPAEVHSDDVMLSAVVSEEVTPLTPVAEEIRVVLNRYSAEAPSGTPDYILANYLIDCLKAFNEAVSLRAVWRGELIEQMILHIDKER